MTWIEKLLVITVILMSSTTVFSQTIECIGEFASGTESSYNNSNTLFNGEIYFDGTNTFDLIKYNDDNRAFTLVEDLEPSFVAITHVESNEEALFYIGSFFSEQRVYHVSDNSDSGSFVVEFEGSIDQRVVIESGLVVIEENNADNLKNGFFIDNQGAAPVEIMNGIDNRQDFAISQSRNIAIISPESIDDFEDGVFFYDTEAGEAVEAEMVITDACNLITEARGFQDFIFYRCGGSNFIYSHETQSSSSVSVSRDDLHCVGESDDFLFMAFQFGSLYAVNKETLRAERIANDMAVFPEFVVFNNFAYYNNANQITVHNGSEEIDFASEVGDNDNLLRVETLNQQIHVIVESGSFSYELFVLNESTKAAELITDLNPFGDLAFHLLNESIIFANRDSDKGQEFFRLTYNPSSTDDDVQNLELSLIPNPTSAQVTVDLEGDISISSFQVINKLGQVVDAGPYNRDIDLSDLNAGFYYIRLFMENGHQEVLPVSKI